ncbi:MAG: COG1615 family transporter, partial [Moorea sp. SIO4A3]|nr:COG1615 family transporter [Moorena sp. SIO4A3]
MTKLSRWVTGLLGIWIAWNLLSHLVAEILWFTEVDYLSAFVLRLQTQLSLWVIVFILSLGFLVTNLSLANQFKHPKNLADLEITWLKGFKTLDSSSLTLNQTQLNSPSPIVKSGVRADRKFSRKRPAFRLRSLLPFALALSLLVGVVLLYYGKTAFFVWDFHRKILSATFLSEATPPLPSPLGWVSIGKLFLSESRSNLVWQLGMISAVMVGLMVNAQLWLRAIALALSFSWAMVISEQWGRILEYLYPTAFNTTEPLFRQDIGFYVFGVPLWQLLDFWLGGLFLFGLVAVWLIYLTSGNSLSDGKFPGFSQNQLRHLYGLGSAVSTITAFHYWLSRYNLLYSTRGVAYGASYTNVSVKLPFNTGLSILAFAIALLLLLRSIVWIRRLPTKIPVALWILGLYLGIWGIAGVILPAAVQRFKVEPNELALERPYIARTIALTRAAFDLDSVEVETFNPQGNLTSTDLEKNHLTIDNIPLWDTRPLLQSNRQL